MIGVPSLTVIEPSTEPLAVVTRTTLVPIDAVSGTMTVMAVSFGAAEGGALITASRPSILTLCKPVKLVPVTTTAAFCF